MDAREYFGPEFFERTKLETFPTFEQWVYMETVRERRAIESLVREFVSTRVDAPPVPPMPATISDPTGAVREAWVEFHSASRLRERSARAPIRYRPKPSRTRVGSEDPSAFPDLMRERMRE